MSYKSLHQKRIPPRHECDHDMFWVAFGYFEQYRICKLCGHGHVEGRPEQEIETELTTFTGHDGVSRHWWPKRRA